MEKAKERIKEKEPCFTDAYQQLIAAADDGLDKPANPVTRKTQSPPSGDKHGYLSIAPYRWPNVDTEDGSPWIVMDGRMNPMSRGDDTYAGKARSILRAWFINGATKVNPNIWYGQGIPGELEGWRTGIIEWSQVSSVVNAIQTLSRDGILAI